MSSLTLHCPHCHAEKIYFYSVKSIAYPKDSRKFTTFFICNGCNGGVVATIFGRNPDEIQGDLRDTSGVDIIDIQPKPAMPNIPEYVPNNIQKFYLQAARNAQQGQYDAAGMMCRKVLESTTRDLGEKTGNLYQRIEALASSHLITVAMRDWAHAIRLDGNEAAHEDDPMEKSTVLDMLNFTELMLMYAYTLPGMLAARQAKKTEG